MNKTTFVCLLVAVHALTAALCHAQTPVPDATQASVAPQASAADQAKLNELLQAPQGVTPVFENGVLMRAYIVISIPLPKSMQPASAKKYAFTRASVQASGEFVKWLHQNVHSKTVDNSQQLVDNKGESNAKETTNSEQSGDKNNISNMTTSEAEGIARGIVSRTYQIKDGELIAIYGWSHKLSQAASQAENMSQGGASAVVPAQPQANPNVSQPAPGNPVQPPQDKKASATNLSDF